MNITPNFNAASQGYGAARKLLGDPQTAQAPDGAKLSAFAKSVESFSEVLKTVETTTQQYATGNADAQAVVEAMATAEMALETAVTVRNRVVEAYQELLRMPI
jgi:flagellar hook-basal body complex protein FliE